MPPPTPPRGARHSRRRPAEEATRAWRWPVILVVVAVLVGAGLIDRAVTAPSVAAPPPVVPAQAAPVDAQSSAWFCTGGSGTAGGVGNATLYLVNSGPKPVAGTVTVTNADGAAAARPVTVPARSQLTVVPSTIEQGAWLASRVDLDGGGVAVSELVSGADGWAQAPCSSTTSASWYFASGATTDGSTLYVSLYNPTSTSAVVDLAFVTSKGVTEPQPFEGVVVAPGQLKVAGVAAYVQDQASVATVVSARSGRVVATELEDHVADGLSGLSLRLGAPAPATRWYVPRTVDVTTGASTVAVLNPAKVAQRVTVHVELKSGSVAPFSEVLPADGTWALATSQAARIPANTTYAIEVTAGGPGVVVDRTTQSSSAGAVPQWGTVSAVDAGSTAAPAGRWAVPNPAAPATPPVGGAQLFALDLQNAGAQTLTVRVMAMTPAGERRLAGVPVLRIPPGVFTVVEPDVLAAAGADPLLLEADGPLAAMVEGSPAGVPGAVAVGAIPLS